MVIFGRPLNWELIILTGLSTFAAYNFQRMVNIHKRVQQQPNERTKWLYKHKTIIWAGIIIAAIMALYLVKSTNLEQIISAIPFGLIALLYANGLLFKRGIRDLPAIKIFAIAATWIYATAVFPLLNNPALFQEEIGLISLFGVNQFIFIVALTIPFDIRDLKFDDANQKTIPQLIGITRSLSLSVILLVLHSAGFSILYYLNIIDIFCFTGAVLANVITAYCITRTSVQADEIYFTGLLDGMLIVQPLLTVGVTTLI